MADKDAAIAVVGAGAIGGVTAAFMKKAGRDPFLVCKHAEIADQVAARGLNVTGVKGDHLVPVRAVKAIDDLPHDLDLVFRIIGFKYRRIRSSSLQSLERGRPTEIDHLNGYICDRAAELEVAVPTHRSVVGMIKSIEAGQRPISWENLKAPVFDGFGH